MKISIYQQNIAETENKQSLQRVNGEKKKNETAVAAAGFYAAGEGWESLTGSTLEKGRSLIELQEEAGHTNAAVRQDYMTVLSNTMSEEDYARMQEEGFDFGSMNPEEAVTIVDKIKAELVRSGKSVAGYTDDLDVETLSAILGSEILANALTESFASADIPMNRENLERTAAAWAMARELKPVDDGTVYYLLDNELDPEIWNLYLAQNSGASSKSGNTPDFAAEDIRGYYSRNAKPTELSELAGQIDRVLEQSGRLPDETNRREAARLLEQGLPLTAANLDRMEQLQDLEVPVTPEDFSRGVASAIAEGKNPVHASLGGHNESIYEKAVRLEKYYQSEEPWEAAVGNLSARRQLEEIRLRMTAEVNVKLLKSGFSIETAQMEQLIEALRKAEQELAEQYFPGDVNASEKYQSLVHTEEVLRELPSLPAQILGEFSAGHRELSVPQTEQDTSSAVSLQDFYNQGKQLKEAYEKAGKRYEELMTAPRKDMGDSIKKAFANVDDILSDMGRELTEENRRGVRILGYNRMELTEENLDRVTEADRQVRLVVERMTPAVTLKMIRDGINPLEKSFQELGEYFDSFPAEYREEAESFSRFLYGLERNQEITPEERESYIGIYRMVRQLEKGDSAAVGAVVNTQAELHFANLLSALRSGRVRSFDAKVDASFGTLDKLLRQGESISEQIGKAFTEAVDRILTEVSYTEEAGAGYRMEQLEQYRDAATAADAECIAMLQKGEMSASAENLMGAVALLHDVKNPFAAGREEKRGGKLWEQLENPENFEKEYKELLELTGGEVEEATTEEAQTVLDVRGLQLAHKQLTIAGRLSDREEFFLPMYMGDRLAKVHLVVKRGENRAGTVEIQIKTGAERGLKACFGFENGRLRGILSTDSSGEVMKTERIADNFTKEAGTNWTMGEIDVTTGDIGEGVFGAGMDAETEKVELYRVAKVFLSAVQEEEVSYED
ncbi:MAG: DUF6240 domain-containing protein [Acetatifactor sp.]